MTSSANPWNEVYKLVACKRKNNTNNHIAEIRRNTKSWYAWNFKHMLEYFTPKDKETDTDYHKLVWTQA